MCIAILTLPGKSLSAAKFDQCWKRNSDGCGFAYINPADGEVIIDKGYMTLEAAKRRYYELTTKFGGSPILIHFRLNTVGETNANNCHPFKVRGGAMIHNGTFWHDRTAKKSDSAMLAEVMHNELTLDALRANKEQFQEAFGYNRVVFLFKGGEYHIVSEHFNGRQGQYGQWKDGIWFSNGGHEGGYQEYCGDDPIIKAREKKVNDDWYGNRGGYGYGRDW